MTKLDHLVIAADTLEQGVAYVEQELGVTLPFGGVHPQMGTHNHLTKLSDELFLEIIAVNRNGNSPNGPRWFNFDDPHHADVLRKSPRLVAWVVNTDDIFRLLRGSACSLGTPEAISRGDLSWHFALPSDGRLLAGGLLPYILQWSSTKHPAAAMADVGLKLKSLTVYHTKPKWLGNMLSSIDAKGLIEIRASSNTAKPSLHAVFDTPMGERELRSYHL